MLLMVLFLPQSGSCKRLGVIPTLFVSAPVLISVSQSICFATLKYASKLGRGEVIPSVIPSFPLQNQGLAFSPIEHKG